MADTLRIGVEVDAAGAPQALQNVERALTRVSSATSSSAAPAGRASEALKKLTGQAGQAAGGLNAIIGGVTSASAAFGGVSPVVQRAGGAIAQFATGIAGAAASMGPWGIAIGAVTAALPLLVDYLSDTNDEVQASTENIKKATSSLDSYISALQRARSDQSRTARIAAGFGTGTEAQAAANMASGALNTSAGRLRAGLEARGIGGERLDQILSSFREGNNRTGTERIRGALAIGSNRANAGDDLRSLIPLLEDFNNQRQNVARATRDLAATLEEERLDQEQEIAEAEEDIRQQSLSGARARGGARGRPRSETISDRILNESLFGRPAADSGYRDPNEKLAHGREPLDVAFAEESRQATERERALRSLAALEAEYAATSSDAATQFADSWRGSTEEIIASFQRLAEAQRQAGQDMADSGDLLGQVAVGASDKIGDAFGDGLTSSVQASFGAIIDGSQSAGEAFLATADAALESIAIESVGQALKQLALGTAAIFTNPPAAPAHFAAAGMWAAAGAVSGGAAAAIDSGGGGGGGGGPSVGGPGSFSGGGSASSEPSTIVVNINSPTDRAQLGQMIRTGVRAAERRYDSRDRGR
ncbi:MAG: hypothetical protein IT379_23585 [Deltaproteobacteria bacterium]|nr:hypothetical protein [Deltaproteobacteria bacterium]